MFHHCMFYCIVLFLAKIPSPLKRFLLFVCITYLKNPQNSKFQIMKKNLGDICQLDIAYAYIHAKIGHNRTDWHFLLEKHFLDSVGLNGFYI